MDRTALGWLAPAVVAAILMSRGIVVWLRRWDQAADREAAAAAELDRQLLHNADWVEADDDEAACACLDCAADLAEDQPVGVTKDGSHDTVRLSMCERITLEQLEREYERGAR